jgi:hypothetical protein
MGKKFIVVRARDSIHYYRLREQEKESIGDGLVQLPHKKSGVEVSVWECRICHSSNLQSDLTCGFCDNPRQTQ